MNQEKNKLKPQYLLTPQTPQLPSEGFLRIWDIVGDKKQNIPALLPIGRTTFLNGVRSGKYPKPVKLGERTIAWKVSCIRALIDEINGTEYIPAKDIGKKKAAVTNPPKEKKSKKNSSNVTPISSLDSGLSGVQ